MANGGIAVGYTQTQTKDFEKVFYDEYAMHKPLWGKVAKVQSSNLRTHKEGRLAGLRLLQEKNIGGAISYEAPTQGAEKETTFTTYSLGIQIPEEEIDDDLTGHLSAKGMMGELGKAAAYTQEIEFWNLFNNGFVSTYDAGYDSAALFADAHTITGGETTIDNNSTASLSQTSLEVALTAFGKIVNDRNVPRLMIPKLLIIPPALKWKAKELLLSELDPESANNNINAFKGEGLNYMVVPYLTSDTAWFVLSADHDLRFMWRKKLAFQNSNDFQTSNSLFKTSQRFATTFWDYRGAYGSSGA